MMPEGAPQGWLAWKPPAGRLRAVPALDALHDVPYAGICKHCLQWVEADDVFMPLPRLERVICMRCYYTITGTRPQLGTKIATDAATAASKE